MAEVSEELAALARRAKWPQLTLLFEMAQIEANRALSTLPKRKQENSVDHDRT